MRIIEKARKRTLYHAYHCNFVTIDCKVECQHCSFKDNVCVRCNRHGWLWGSSNNHGVGFQPYTLQPIYF